MMEDFSDLALPPLFGGHILEAELETEGVEFVDGGGVSESQVEEESQERERRESERERDRRKYCNLSRRCREIEQVNERTLNRLHQVQKLSRQLKKERRFLMKTLNSYGDDYRSAQLTFLLEEELSGTADSALLQSASSNKRKRHRAAKEKEAQLEGEMSSHSETHVSGYCSGSSPVQRTPSDFP
ncbi:TCF3 fusion partner homolog isoform X2 [Acipenser ruthenus]|uniref:TCF3 fusion partner homolog isoform X2 n=1 Tax=Acipenser ruthenus TaxID=7906 RepID=UPI0015615D80|nr:TCF3 fusion partner homolog isoform X2 [Acipenser ruthenus]